MEMTKTKDSRLRKNSHANPANNRTINASDLQKMGNRTQSLEGYKPKSVLDFNTT